MLNAFKTFVTKTNDAIVSTLIKTHDLVAVLNCFLKKSYILNKYVTNHSAWHKKNKI